MSTMMSSIDNMPLLQTLFDERINRRFGLATATAWRFALGEGLIMPLLRSGYAAVFICFSMCIYAAHNTLQTNYPIFSAGLGGSVLITAVFPLLPETRSLLIQTTILLGILCGIAFGGSAHMTCFPFIIKLLRCSTEGRPANERKNENKRS